MSGIYIHIPFCKSKCAYCDFPSWPGREGDAGRYFDAVIREAEMMLTPPVASRHPPQGGGQVRDNAKLWMSDNLPPSLREVAAKPPEGVFTTVFIGGGTPSLLPAGTLERFMDRLRSVLPIDPVEFTVEANPGTVDREKLASFRRMGAGRLSFGAQAAQDALLKRIGRIHTWADFVRSFELAREAGFSNISADMMTGLPGMTRADAVETAEKLVSLGPEHVSCYGLIVEEGTPLAQAIQKGDEIPPDDAERDMFHAARSIFEGAGLRRYEISNFAKPGHECRHNLNYWHNGDWLGLGCGAASHFHGCRRESHSDLDEYMAALERGALPPADEHDIGPEEAVFETIMLELRLVEGINFKKFEEKHGFSFPLKYDNQIEKFIQSGLMRKTLNGVALTEKGMDLQNTVLLEFMD